MMCASVKDVWCKIRCVRQNLAKDWSSRKNWAIIWETVTLFREEPPYSQSVLCQTASANDSDRTSSWWSQHIREGHNDMTGSENLEKDKHHRLLFLDKGHQTLTMRHETRKLEFIVWIQTDPCEITPLAKIKQILWKYVAPWDLFGLGVQNKIW